MFDRLRANGLSGSTMKSVRSCSAAMFRHAERDLGAIPRNPVRDLDRGDLPPAKRQSEPRYLSVENVESQRRLRSHRRRREADARRATGAMTTLSGAARRARR
jgi:hypothetical protein